MRFYPSGAEFIKLNSGSGYEQVHYSFDGEWFAKMLRFVSKAPEGTTWTAPTDELLREEKRLAPKIKWYYAEGVEDTVWNDRHDKRQTRLDDCISSLEHVAQSYSTFGDIVTINLYYDTTPTEERPTSYYFDIRDNEGRRCMNGGVIAHKRTDKETGEDTWEYSTHT